MAEKGPGSLDLVRSYVAALKHGDTEAMRSLRADSFVLDHVWRDASRERSLDEPVVTRFWPAWFAGFSDFDFQAKRTVAAETVVVVEWIFTGTHDGPLGEPVFDPAVQATGRTIRFRGISVYDVQHGHIQTETEYLDLATLMVELGIHQ